VSCMKSIAHRSLGRFGISGTCRLTALFRLRGFFLRRLGLPRFSGQVSSAVKSV